MTHTDSVKIVDYLSFYFEQTRQAFRIRGSLRTRDTQASDIEILGQMYSWQSGTENAAMFAISLDRLRRFYNPNWLTPIAYTIEAYARAGLFENAETIAAECEANGIEIKVGRQPVERFLERQRRELQKRNIPAATLTRLYQHVAAFYL